MALECKLAQGRDGKGALPEDFWPSYSAMANTDGGLIVLGVREHKGRLEAVGIEDVAKVRMELFNNLNNRQKVSANVLSDAHVRECCLNACTLLLIDVPRAPRKLRPVYLTANPFGHTYRRLNEGDRLVADEEVKRMLAEQVEDSRDEKILPITGWMIWIWGLFRRTGRYLPTASRGIPGMQSLLSLFCKESGAGVETGERRKKG